MGPDKKDTAPLTVYMDGQPVGTAYGEIPEISLTAEEPVEAVPSAAFSGGSVTITLEQTDYPLTIRLEPGRVRIGESACPSQDCVHTGWVSRSGGQIVCLPNRLIITITGSDAPQADAVTG